MDREDMQAFLAKVKTQRDELQVQMHLAKAEARDLWEEMEKKWREMELKAKQVGGVAAEASHDVGDAVRALGTEIKAGYERIRKSL